MLKDFLTNNEEDVVMENVSVMAAMLGEETDVALEGVSELVEKFKTKLTNAVEMIRKFIAKVVAWIKEKFFSLLKRDMELPEKLWKDAQAVLSLCDKTQMGFTDKLVVILKASHNLSEEKIAQYTAIKNSISDSLNNIKESEAYSNIMHGGTYQYTKDGSKNIRVSGSKLSGQNKKFQELLESFKQQASALESKKSEVSQESAAASKIVQLGIEAANLGVRITEIRISILNKLESMSKPAGKSTKDEE